MAAIRSSRALLFPGPLAPLSHLGATMLRHATNIAVRYSLHALGLTMPDESASSIVRLRPCLDGRLLARHLPPQQGGPIVLAALLEPGGVGIAPTGRLRGAVLFHRCRLSLRVGGLRQRHTTASAGGPQQELAALEAQLRDAQPALNETFLGELTASLRRRAERGKGTDIAPCLGREAWTARTGGEPRLDRLGPADVFAPSWLTDPEAADLARAQFTDAVPQHDRFRGSFRETWRATLERLRPPLLRLAQSAAERGLLERPSDAFFVPYDLAGDLASESPTDWLRDAAASNRREYEALLDTPAPAEILRGTPDTVGLGRGQDPAAAPLWPLN